MISLGSNEELLPTVTVENEPSSTDGDDDVYEAGPVVLKHPPATLLEKICASGEIVDAMLMEYPVSSN